MSGTFDDSNRQAIPRCLDYSSACALGLLRSTKEQQKNNTPDYQNSNTIDKWHANPSIYTAVDLLAEAMILKDFESEDAIKAANYILKDVKTTSTILIELASHFLKKPSIQDNQPTQLNEADVVHKSIADLKKSVRFYDKNPIAWCDMAQQYALLGQMDKARIALKVALNLAPNNRFILRAASSCLLHFGEPDRAVSLLSRSPLHSFDPWITSAEIAISESADLPNKSISKAKDLVNDDNLTHFSRSELAVSIGTKEMKSGANRRAKDLMRQGIIDPTENALAQAEWMSTHLGTKIGDFVKLRQKVPASFEADSRYLFNQKKFEDSLKAGEHWCKYQPVSSIPFIFSSYISSVCLDNEDESLRILNNGLHLHRNDALFMNNYICSLVKTGDLYSAISTFNSLNLSNITERLRFTFMATQGLILFRTGNPKKARELYLNAIIGFERINEPRTSAVAAYYWALEEKRIFSSIQDARIKDVKNRVKRYNVFELDNSIKKL